MNEHSLVQGWMAARGWRAAWSWSLLLVTTLRLGLGIVMGCVWLAVRSYLPASLRLDTALSDHMYGRLAEAALAVWPRWDAVHYLILARVGYSGVGVGDSVYYPLYPGLVGLVAPLLAADYIAAGLLVSTLASIAAFALLYHLAEQRFGPSAARWSILALAAYPTAFFLLAPFTEALFIALTLGAFAAATARRWWLAGALGALASLTRGPGLLTAAALAWIAWRQWREPIGVMGANIVTKLTMACGVLLPVAGGAAFLFWRAAYGFPSMDEVLKQYSGLEAVDPVRGLAYALIQFVRVHDLPTTLDMASVFVFLAVLTAMIRNPRWRVGEWLIYMSLNLATFLSKRSLVAASLQSMARYVLVLFPAFIVAGDWLSRQRQQLRFVLFLASGVVLIVLSVGYSLWWFIG